MMTDRIYLPKQDVTQGYFLKLNLTGLIQCLYSTPVAISRLKCKVFPNVSPYLKKEQLLDVCPS